MELNQEIDLSQYSVYELKEIIIKRVHRGSMITAARKELEKRGISLTQDEIKQRDLIKESSIAEAKKSENPFKQNLDKVDNIVNDENAPELYSRRILYAFSVLAFSFFGAIMFCMNLARIQKQKYIWLILTYSLSFTSLEIYLLGFLKINLPAYLLNALGYLPIDLFFWNKYIGKTAYRKRGIVVPILIALGITALIIWGSLYQ